MSNAEFPEQSVVGRPKAWRYFVSGGVAYPILFLLWLVFDLQVLHPELMDFDTETTMDKLRWFGVPLLLAMVAVGGSWIFASIKADARESAWIEKSRQLDALRASANTEQARREYVLEVIGLGVTFEKYRQEKLWEALQKGGSSTSLRETDPKKYAWSDFDKIGVSGGRACDALENGAQWSPMYFGVPTFYAGPSISDPADQPSDINPVAGLAASADGTGMAWHLFVTAPSQLGEHPDRLLEQVFAFFDAHPDLPYVVLLADDSTATRNSSLPPGAPQLIVDGYHIPEMPDSTAVLVLARRERAEPLRPYAWDDPDNDYLQENLRWMYIDLENSVPTPKKLAEPDKYNRGRQPTVAEWLPAAAAFAKHPIHEKKDTGYSLAAFRRWINNPPKDWKPTPWFPLPWNRHQLKAFDSLPSFGFIHRPVFVRYEDENGKPVKRRDARQKILEAGWQQALQTLPEAERAQGPTRIVAAFGKHSEQQIAFSRVLDNYAAQGGPEIDTGKTAQFINTDHRFGNTGASTFFIQMAVGVMGGYYEGGISAAANLRDPDGASFVFISPPAKGLSLPGEASDPLRHQVEPAIDPENYKPPTVGTAAGMPAGG